MLKIIIFISSAVYPVLAASLLPTIFYGYYEKNYDYANSLVVLLLITLIFSFVIRRNILPTRKLSTIQGFGAVGISWILISVYGTIPYLLANIKLPWKKRSLFAWMCSPFSFRYLIARPKSMIFILCKYSLWSFKFDGYPTNMLSNLMSLNV